APPPSAAARRRTRTASLGSVRRSSNAARRMSASTLGSISDIAPSICPRRRGCRTRRRGLQRDVRLAALIPSRYASQRLPGKPLADLCGAPMIVRVCQRTARAEGLDEIAVATDDPRIAQAVTQAGFRAVMTGEARNGTERIAQAAALVGADGYLNVQGHVPLVDPRPITAVADLVR